MNFIKRVPTLIHNSFKLLVDSPSLTGINNLNIIQPILKNTLTINRLHKRGPIHKVREGNKVMDGRPFLKGVILKTLIRKPRKPNSANRKCVLVRLSTGKETVAYVPGVGHNLQEHQFVLVRGGRVKDLPGVKVKCVRGAYDLPHARK